MFKSFLGAVLIMTSIPEVGAQTAPQQNEAFEINTQLMESTFQVLDLAPNRQAQRLLGPSSSWESRSIIPKLPTY
jgi:hypothetical protein